MKKNTCCIFGESVLLNKFKKLNFVKNKIIFDLEWAILNNKSYFIVSITNELELITAETLLKLKEKYQHVKIECVLPYQVYGEERGIEYMLHRDKVLSQVDKRTIINYKKTYNLNKYMDYLINNSDMVLIFTNTSLEMFDDVIKQSRKSSALPVLCKI